MIELGQQSKPKKIPRTFNNTQKNPYGPKINPQQEPMGHGLLTPNRSPKTSHTKFPSLKTYQALNDITQQIKTIERKFA